MRRAAFFSSGLVACILLAGCNGKKIVTVEEYLKNPLYAERYAEETVDRLVELDIVKDHAVKDAAKKAYVDEQRKHWLEVSREARNAQREGTEGNFISIGEHARGDALYQNDRLYFGSLFEVDPLPALRVYLTTVVDPRDVAFPDETALDLGPLQTAYGAQTYAVPSVANPLLYRTVVLWETKLGRLHSFAQLNK